MRCSYNCHPYWQKDCGCTYVGCVHLAHVESHKTPGRSDGIQWIIRTCLGSEHSPLFILRRTAAMTMPCQVWSGMTKDQLWHRLSGAPNLARASLWWFSHAPSGPASDQSKTFAQRIFDLLCTTQGLLTVVMRGLENSSDETDHGCHVLHIQRGYWRGSLVWSVDGKRGITEHPDIKFDDMPKKVTKVVARLSSHHAT